MDNDNNKTTQNNKTLHEAISDSMKKGREWAQEELFLKAKNFAKLVENEAKWIGNKSKESAEKFKQSETFARIKDSAEKIKQSDTVNKAKETLSQHGKSKKFWWYIGGALAVLFLGIILFGGDDYSNDYPVSSSKQADYSWLYGTWEANLGGIRDEITITEYSITQANIYSYDTGSYRIEGNSLKAKYSNDPSGIVSSYQIDPSAHTISSEGCYYRKIK